jgi:hypothetical protein
MALVCDLQDMTAAAERVRIQVAALADRHGVRLPEQP